MNQAGIIHIEHPLTAVIIPTSKATSPGFVYH